ncbi:hypothetical protein QBC33DRAFT_499729 [Phialemonium atrogriseum]|uniref:Uncharacterized protein n=1 Tax=Phialemonium atrogriseum TaxID=1093897 RepID=A0AAJ0BW80_9PEZI|nr:uncharacterized protein QBC33DRAFT_499729 [Phialemonium atrogriseum]KAK1763236.1 hypothetical protein QBC33DRAFT_499729 [Phialemonium atrogriseum]
MASAQDTPHPSAERIGLSGPVDTTAPFDPAGVAGKTILITGGASGIGAAFARAWAAHGANMVVGDVDEAAGQELVAELRTSTGSPHHHFQFTDVTNWQSQVSLFQTAARLSPTGGIDAVVPNAGIAHGGGPPTAGFENPQGLDGNNPPEPKFKVVDVNLTGVMYTVHLALFWLPRNTTPPDKLSADGKAGWPFRDRHILLIGSIAGIMPLMGSADYTVSKHGVTALFRCLRGTALKRGIRVNMICPCFIDTNMLANPVMLVLAGGGLGELRDVVDAGTRFMADRMIAGRAVVIGPRMKVEDGEDGEIRLVGIPSPGDETKGVWECYAHDYEHMEAFFYRYTRLLYAFAMVRGWLGWARDVVWIIFRRKK